MRYLFIIAALLVALQAPARDLSLADFALLPTPQQIMFGNRMVQRGEIARELVRSIEGVPADNPEAYAISIGEGGVRVRALTPEGLFRAQVTLEQLAQGDSLPVCEIVDWPAFLWRGFMMDTGRSYISLEELKREIDIMSQFKLNIFHWHLTENQAWRLESLRYPALNDSANMERDPGEFYTLAQVRELVDYARERLVTIVPEIDMPGHSAAFVRTFGVDMQSAEGMQILKDLLEEACGAFEVPYIHIGTDEVKFTNADFACEMVEFVRNLGKKVISWNPGWNYREGEVDMTHMWSFRGKPTPGIPAIDLRFHYINHFDSYADLIALFRSNVYGHKKAEDGIEGVEIALWNDRKVSDQSSLITQNSLYPNLLALAERSWSGGGEEYFDRHGTNICEDDSADFAAIVDFERRLLHHKSTTLAELDIPYVKQTGVRWLITDAFPNNGDLTAVFPPETEGLKTEYIYNDSVYATTPAIGAGIYLRHVWGDLIPAFYSNPRPNHTAYAFTRVYSPDDRIASLQAETQNYSRSEADIPPPQGQWDFRGSRIWVNGKEIEPPVWTATHSERSNEIPLGNENFAARPPIAVELHKGWNDVLIKLPVGEFRTPQTRLVKWMFTFVFTDTDLIYNPLGQ